MNKRRRIAPTAAEIPVDCWRNVQEYLTQDEIQSLWLVNTAIREVSQPQLNLIKAFINQRTDITFEKVKTVPIKFENPLTGEYNREAWCKGVLICKTPEGCKTGDVFIGGADYTWYIKTSKSLIKPQHCAYIKEFTLNKYPLAYWNCLSKDYQRTEIINNKNLVGNKYYVETEFNGQVFWLFSDNLDSYGLRKIEKNLYFGFPTGHFSF